MLLCNSGSSFTTGAADRPRATSNIYTETNANHIDQNLIFPFIENPYEKRDKSIEHEMKLSYLYETNNAWYSPNSMSSFFLKYSIVLLQFAMLISACIFYISENVK